MSTNVQIEITVNGERRSIASGQTIGQLLAELQIDPARVAVEMDRAIVKPHAWQTTAIAGGAELEIVQFVGGG